MRLPFTVCCVNTNASQTAVSISEQQWKEIAKSAKIRTYLNAFVVLNRVAAIPQCSSIKIGIASFLSCFLGVPKHQVQIREPHVNKSWERLWLFSSSLEHMCGLPLRQQSLLRPPGICCHQSSCIQNSSSAVCVRPDGKKTKSLDLSLGRASFNIVRWWHASAH